jgi:transposase-like protein
MAKTPTVQDFFKQFPTDEACLEHLMLLRFGNPIECPKCSNRGQFAKLKKLPAYACPTCGHHIHPMVGTPFERSSTPLQKWFYAMYLFTTSRHGVPAKELQRQLGVTYKTAWRMGHEIRKYMGKTDGTPPMTGHVEVDETYLGGRKPKVKGFTGRGAKGKSVIMGIAERDGELFTQVVPNASKHSLIPLITKHVPRGTRISTDMWAAYRTLKVFGYFHDTVDHAAKEYARGDVHVNTLEGFWSMLKRSIRGTHIHVSRKHLPKYLGEFEFRWNLRRAPETMFARLLTSF